jgi:Protein of unknown function (DUF3097)
VGQRVTRDILDELAEERRRPSYPEVTVSIGMVVEDRASGFCGDVVKVSIEAVTLRDRAGDHRHFRFKPGGFLFEGKPVSLVRADQRAAQAGGSASRPTTRTTNSGSVAPARSVRAQVAKANRIWVEGKHDAELLEHVWGDDLRDAGIVVEPLHGIDDLVAAVADFHPGPQRLLGILVDHLVPGSKEQRLAARVSGPHVLVTGHPFVDVWEGVRPKLLGLEAWPTVPRDVQWKAGICAALGVDPNNFWPRLRAKVRTFADLRPELVGAVEQLIDFVAAPHDE